MSVKESLDKISNMYDKEKSEFARLANYLMSATFMLRDDANHCVSKDYLFVERRLELFSDYFSLIGWRIYKDTQYGVIYTLNADGMNRQSLDKLTSAILIAIRLIYEEKRVQASSSNDVYATISEILGKLVNDFSIYKKQPSKKELKDSLRILESHNLIYKAEGSFTEYECKLKLLPSVLFAVSNEKCKTICDILTSDKGEDDEEAEQTAAD